MSNPSPNPFAPPRAEVQDVAAPGASFDIASLPVSESWKTKFRLIEKAGGVKQPNFKALAFGERMKIAFNILGFLFGPIYYIVKGMWKKGLALFAACFVAVFVVALVLELMGLGRLANAVGYAAAAIFAVRANIDYYKKMVLGENGWW